MRVVVKCSAGALFGLAALVLSSGSALADASDQSEIHVPAAAASECPESVSNRYPWITCRTSTVGTLVIADPRGNDTWENSRILPGRHPFVEGDGYWGAAPSR